MQKTERNRKVERGGFFVFLTLITLALGWLVWPFASALLWAALAAIMFQPLYLWNLRKFGGRENYAATATLLIITFAVIVPSLAIGSMVVDEAIRIYLALQEQRLGASFYFDRFYDSLPFSLQEMLDSSGYGEFAVLQSQVLEFLRESVGLIARQAVTIGGNAFFFVVSFAVGIYTTYFMLRDGRRLGPALRQALPLEPDIAHRLTDRFLTIVHATIKGTVIVGLVQGTLGAITFWIVGVPSVVLFGLLMALLSLLPALGTAIVWFPVAIYLLVTGSIWQGFVVISSGVLVISLADNLLRPILVGRDTGIPDWIVLVATLSGLAAFGLSGVIVGPVLAGLFLAGWSILREQRGET